MKIGKIGDKDIEISLGKMVFYSIVLGAVNLFLFYGFILFFSLILTLSGM